MPQKRQSLIPRGILIESFYPSLVLTGAEPLGWGALARNSLPVVLGNIIGGSVMVGAVYSTIYRSRRKPGESFGNPKKIPLRVTLRAARFPALPISPFPQPRHEHHHPENRAGTT